MNERELTGAGGGFFGAFEVRPFRWVWSAALSGNSGRFALILVAGWEAYRLGHHSSVWPGLVSFLLLAPTMCFGLVSGGFADRVSRAKQAASGQLLNAASCAAAGVLAVSGHLTLAGVLITTAVVGLGNSVQAPAWQSLIPALVGRERLLNAAALTRIAQQGAELTGPALGTIVLTSAGVGPVFFLCSAFYGCGSLMLWSARHASPAPRAGEAAEGILGPIGRGLAYMRANPPLPTLISWVGLHCSLTMALFGILPAVASANLKGEAGAYGLLLTAFGVGSVAAPLLLMAIADRCRPASLLLVSALASSAPLVGLGFTHTEPVALALAMLAGGGQAAFMVGIFSSTMTVADDAMRGRVASIQLSLTTGTMGIASLGWAALVGLIAPGVVLALPGAVFLAVSVPFARRRRGIDDGVLRGRQLKEPTALDQEAGMAKAW